MEEFPELVVLKKNPFTDFNLKFARTPETMVSVSNFTPFTSPIVKYTFRMHRSIIKIRDECKR